MVGRGTEWKKCRGLEETGMTKVTLQRVEGEQSVATVLLQEL